MKTKKSVFFARLKKWAACLWPTGGRRQILRLSLLKKQGLSSTPSRAKTVLIRVKNKFSEISEICGWEYFNQKYQIMRNEPNFRNTKNEPKPLYNKRLCQQINCFDDAKTKPNEPNL